MTNSTIARQDFPYFERKLRARLPVLRAEIRNVLLRTDSEQYAQIAGQVHDADDESLADLLVDVNLAEIDRDLQEVRDIDAALRRILMGTYGTCVDCGSPIDRQRQDATPTATRCLSCQQKHERAPGHPAPPSL